MARTIKWEHPTDSWHLNHRAERKARPAGRLLAIIDEEMALDEPTPDEVAMWDAFEADLKASEDAYWREVEVAAMADDMAWRDYERGG